METMETVRLLGMVALIMAGVAYVTVLEVTAKPTPEFKVINLQQAHYARLRAARGL